MTRIASALLGVLWLLPLPCAAHRPGDVDVRRCSRFYELLPPGASFVVNTHLSSSDIHYAEQLAQRHQFVKAQLAAGVSVDPDDPKNLWAGEERLLRPVAEAFASFSSYADSFHHLRFEMHLGDKEKAVTALLDRRHGGTAASGTLDARDMANDPDLLRDVDASAKALAAALKTMRAAQRDATLVLPAPGSRRAQKSFAALSSSAREAAVNAIDAARRNPRLGETKTTFRSAVRVSKFSADGVSYRLAWEIMPDGTPFFEAVGARSDFYESLKDLQK